MSAGLSPAFRLWPQEFEAFREETRLAIEALIASNPPAEKPKDRREFLRQSRVAQAAQAKASPLAEEREIAGVPCRILRPPGPPRAVYLHIHGGGMVLGAAISDDPINEARCLEHGIVVVSVDYRLAPEHPFPAGPDDCFVVARWLCEGGSAGLGSERLLLGGESAGAYMATVTMLRVRDQLDAAKKVAGLNLIFGIYDMGGTPSQRGMRPHGGFDVLDPAELDFVRDSFVPGLTNDDRRHPSISPLYADLHGLPPALFTVGASDHVFDDSVFMASRWAAAGNHAELAVYPDCPHGFPILETELGRRGRARIESFISGIIDQPV